MNEYFFLDKRTGERKFAFHLHETRELERVTYRGGKPTLQAEASSLSHDSATTAPGVKVATTDYVDGPALPLYQEKHAQIETWHFYTAKRHQHYSLLIAPIVPLKAKACYIDEENNMVDIEDISQILPSTQLRLQSELEKTDTRDGHGILGSDSNGNDHLILQVFLHEENSRS